MALAPNRPSDGLVEPLRSSALAPQANGTAPTRGAVSLAGALGFEPRDGGTKTRCLTAWLCPNAAKLIAFLVAAGNPLAADFSLRIRGLPQGQPVFSK